MITVLLTGNRDNLVQNSYQNRFAFATHAHTHSHTHTHPKKNFRSEMQATAPNLS